MLEAKRLLFGLAVLVVGCTESVESEDIRTTGIYPEITVVADGSGSSRLSVRLKVGGNSSDTYLDIVGDDRLEATVGDTTRELDDTGSHTYSATFSEDAEGTEFVVSFLRGEDDDDAPASIVRLPAPFELTLGTTQASRATDDVEYTWDPPASGNIDWSVDGDCIMGDSGSTPDDGTNTLTGDSLDTFDSDAEETCTVDLSLVRAQSGELDPAFTEGGEIEARQVRAGSFTSEP